jgi:hypothetical protein
VPSTVRLRAILAVLTILAASCAAPAQAADVAVDGNQLVFRAAPGEANVVVVEPSGLAGYDVFDDGARLNAGDGCEPLARRSARCSGLILSADIDVGDRDDIVEATVPIPVVAHGGARVDLLAGGAAGDSLEGDDGVDTVIGGVGDDRLGGGAGSNRIDGDTGKDAILGGPGSDVADGGPGDGDFVSGGLGADLVSGGSGDDQVNGDDGNDAMTAGGGSDTITTGTGADQVFLAADSTSAIDCRPGDTFRGGVPLEPGCGALAPQVPAPTAWPPPSARPRGARTGGVSARTAQVLRKARPSGRVLRRGHTTLMVVRVPADDNRLVRVRIQPFERSGRPLRAFTRAVHGFHKDRIDAPPLPPVRTWRIRVTRGR